MRYKETFDLSQFEDRIKLAKLLLDKSIEFKTKSIELEFAD